MSTVEKLLGCKYPVIQGGMGLISNPEMVAAVSEAGGFGLLAPSFAADVDVFYAQVQATKKLTQKPFGANLQIMNPMVNQFIRVLAEEGVKAVTISGGSPKKLIPLLHEKGMKAIVVVSNTSSAKKSETFGADAIVAEGCESGGLQGFKGASTMVIVPAVVDAVSIPVIAAGGISDSRGYKAAKALGAGGVQVGTRFIATKECIAHQNYKQLLIESDESGTGMVRFGTFQIRSLSTELVAAHLSNGTVMGGAFSTKSLENAWVNGDIGAGLLPAGQVTGLIKNIASVKEIIEEMVL